MRPATRSQGGEEAAERNANHPKQNKTIGTSMDAEQQETVEEPISMRKRQRQHKSDSASPATPQELGDQRKKKRRSRKKHTPEKLYNLKTPGILRQQIVKGKVQYLLNWADDPETGEPYSPTWEPHEYVTEAARAEWQNRPSPGKVLSSSPVYSAPDSQPIESIKRRRSSSSRKYKSQTPSRKRRKTGRGDLASLESSREEVDSGLPSEIKDSYEEDGQSLSIPAGPRVEVPVAVAFDPSEYQVFPSSQPIGSQLSEPSQSISKSPSAPAIETPVRKSKPSHTCDEEEPDGGTPDSQESGSESYIPTQTQFSTGLATASSGGLSSQLFASQLVGSLSPEWNSSRAQSEISGIVETQSEELDSEQAHATYAESTSQDTSSHSVAVSKLLSTQTQSEFLSQDFSDQSSQDIESSEPLPSAQAVVDQLTQFTSSALPISTQESPFAQVQVDWSNGGAQNQNQTTSAQSSPDLNQSSSPAFLTQIPLPREADIIRQAGSYELREGSACRILFTQEEVPLPENTTLVDSCTLQAESSQLPASQIPPPSFLAHQSLQLALSSSPPRHSSIEQACEIPSQGQAIDDPIRYQSALLDADGHQSQSKSEDSYPSSHLPSPPLEEDPSIVEASEETEALAQPVRQSTPVAPEQLQIAQSSAPSTPVNKMEQEDRPTPRLSATQIIKQKMAEAAAKYEAEYDAKLAARDAERGLASASTASSSTAPPILASPSPEPPAIASPSPQPPIAASPSHLPPIAGEPQIAQRSAPPTLSHMLPAIELSERTTKPTFNAVIELDSDTEEDAIGIDLIALQKEEYCIPLPMVSGARSIYVQTVRNNRVQVHSFSNDEYFESSLVKDIDSMMVDLELLCDHQDLIESDSATQRMDSDEIQAKWAENVSTKCIFLSELLQAMRRSNQCASVMVLVRPGRMLEILESMIKFHGFIYNRADIPEWKGDMGALRVSLVPSSGKDLRFERPSIIIGFDSSHRAIPNLLELRTNPKTNTVAPLFSLLITNSVEHIERCLGKDVEVMDRKVSLVRCVSQLNEDVGILRPGYDEPERAAAAAAEFLSHRGSWPLRRMPLIELVDIGGHSTDEVSRPSSSRKLSNELSSSVQVAQSGHKRSMEPESIGSKRQKLSPSSGNVSHITSSTVPKATAEFIATIEDADALDEESADQVVALLKKINDLELSLGAEKETSASLLSINNSLEARCTDYESSIASIRPKYQEALNDRGQFEYSYNRLYIENDRLVEDNQAKAVELTSLKDLTSTLTTQLYNSREALKNSTVPEIAEFETMRAELSVAKEKATKLEKRIQNQKNDLEYMRTNYQNASSAAVESASEIRDLKDEVMELRGKADATRVKIQKLITEKEISELVKRNQELKNRCEEFERLLEMKNDELRALMAGRRTTRGTSVPRSPRLGSTVASPSHRRGPLGAVVGGSRGTSPAPGDGGSIRGGFNGEALFQDGKGRWGSHLRDQ